MFSFSEPRDFVDWTDLDIESEWNPHYEDLPVSTPLVSPEAEPQLPSEPFLYECVFCLQSHLPMTPCDHNNYSHQLKLPQLAMYPDTFGGMSPEFPERKNSFLESNYRKWVVSVTPP